ncbi:GD16507 [Drosophila simulans]|uniref:GD16507 n=1 Tax=Drosophila simulans TaxID=7240 RepID=B4R7E5_DROSI|nr:GD16507 [Drosophila simulans]
MLLNCTRLTHLCTTLRVRKSSQIRLSTSYNHHLGRCLHQRTARSLQHSLPPPNRHHSYLHPTLRMPWWCMRRGLHRAASG